jgi:hypothetical protein
MYNGVYEGILVQYASLISVCLAVPWNEWRPSSRRVTQKHFEARNWQIFTIRFYLTENTARHFYEGQLINDV